MLTPAAKFAFKLPRMQTGAKKISLGTFFGIVTLVMYLSYQAGISNNPPPALPLLEKSDQQSVIENLNLLEKENAQLRQQLLHLDSNYHIELAAKKNLALHLKGLQRSNLELSRDMSLYQALAGGKSVHPQGVQIKSFHASALSEKNKFRYLVILAQHSASTQAVQGAIAMTIVGKIGFKSIRLPVKYVNSSRQDGLAFKFNHFQELAGELAFPENFVPERVLLQVNADGGRSFSQQFPWHIEEDLLSD